MSRWPSVPLASPVRSGRGISYGIVQPGFPQPNGIPVLRVIDIPNGRVDTRSPLRVAPHVEAAHARTRLAGGELLLTLVSTVEETAVVPDDLKDWNVARAIAGVPVDEGVGVRWVKLMLEEPAARALIKARLNTTVQATLNLRDVADLPVLMPPVRERLATMDAICALDDKIELNRRISQTLEAIAQAIFKSWFVDLSAADLVTVPLSELALMKTSAVHPSKSPDRLFEYFSIRPFDDARLPVLQLGGEIKSNKFKVQPSAVLVSKLNPQTPRVLMPHVRTTDAVCSTGFMQFVPWNKVQREFLYPLTFSEAMQAEVQRRITGSAGSRQPAHPTKIARLAVLVPRGNLATEVSNLVRPLLKQVQELATQAVALKHLCDSLLPKLLCGELTPTAA